MAETHLLMNIGAFIAAMWWTKSWLMDRLVARWRFFISAFAGTILWVYVAYSSTRVVDPSSGVGHVFGSMGLAYFAVFMAAMSILGGLLGLVLWAEEEGEKAVDEFPDAVETNWSD